jgi:hypothetical protein
MSSAMHFAPELAEEDLLIAAKIIRCLTRDGVVGVPAVRALVAAIIGMWIAAPAADKSTVEEGVAAALAEMRKGDA